MFSIQSTSLSLKNQVEYPKGGGDWGSSSMKFVTKERDQLKGSMKSKYKEAKKIKEELSQMKMELENLKEKAWVACL